MATVLQLSKKTSKRKFCLEKLDLKAPNDIVS